MGGMEAVVRLCGEGGVCSCGVVQQQQQGVRKGTGEKRSVDAGGGGGGQTHTPPRAPPPTFYTDCSSQLVRLSYHVLPTNSSLSRVTPTTPAPVLYLSFICGRVHRVGSPGEVTGGREVQERVSVAACGNEPSVGSRCWA